MTASTLHPQFMLAAIRKAYGSAAAFERAHSLPKKSVHDVMRGRRSARVMRAIEGLLSDESEFSASNRNLEPTHRIKPVNPRQSSENGSAAA